MPYISVNPDISFADEPVVIRVTDLTPRQKVTLYSSQKSPKGKLFHAHALYQANDKGTVNLDTDESVGGSYVGQEPMGLFWAKKTIPEKKKSNNALVTRNVTIPSSVRLSVFEGFHNFQAEYPKFDPLASVTINRWYKAPNIERIPINKGDIRGILFLPRSEKNLLGVIDIGGMYGGVFEMRASLLARHGFAVFCLSLFGLDDQSKRLPEVDLEVIERASDYLQSFKEVRNVGVGIVGVSYGGAVALAASGCVRGVVCAVNISGPVTACNWTDFKYKHRIWKAPTADESLVEIKEGVRHRKNVLEIPSLSNMHKHIPDFHKSDSSVLFAYGDEDEIFNLEKSLDLVQAMFQSSGKTNYKILVYPGAGHVLLTPYVPVTPLLFMNPFDRQQTFFGGRPKEHATAQEKLWREMIQFFKKNIPIRSQL